jgi:hypothetical protein
MPAGTAGSVGQRDAAAVVQQQQQASTQGGSLRPQQPHDPAALQNFLNLHARFNQSESRQKHIEVMQPGADQSYVVPRTDLHSCFA